MKNLAAAKSGPKKGALKEKSWTVVPILVLAMGLIFSGAAVLPTAVISTSLPIVPLPAIQPYLKGLPQAASGPYQCNPHGNGTDLSLPSCWPMGLADYGVNPSNDHLYSYHTQSFEASITINSINIGQNTCGNLCGGGEDILTLQQNTVANISAGGVEQTYWTQDVPFLLYFPATQTYSIVPLDNIWNFTGPLPNVADNMTDVTGNLNSQCVAYGGAPVFYECEAPEISNLKLPLTIGTKMTLSEECALGTCSNYVTFYMDIYHGSKLVYSNAYDKVEFTNGNALSRPHFYVEPCLPLAPSTNANFGKCTIGHKESPIKLPYDAEWIIGGPADGSQVRMTQINAVMTESFLNETTGLYQSIPHAYSTGWDTAEGAGNVQMTSPGSPDAIAHAGPDNVLKPLW